MREGMEKYAKEYSIKSVIQVCKDLGHTVATTTSAVMKQFDLSNDVATQKVSEYWNASMNEH